MAKLKILVTGCSGLLGVAVCQELLENNMTVYALDKSFPDGSRIHDISPRIDNRRRQRA